MSATLDNMGIIQHENLVGVPNGFQTVGNHNNGLVMGQCLNRPLQFVLILRVNAAGGSSRMMMGAFFSMARAMETRCFSPPDRVPPPSPITVL